MALVAERPALLGNLLKSELGAEHAYSREMKVLTVAAYSPVAPHGVEIGGVYKADGTIVVAADVAAIAGNAVRILIDDNVYMDGHADGENAGAYAVLGSAPAGGGMVVVAREALKFGDALSAGQIDAVVVELNAQGIKVANQV